MNPEDRMLRQWAVGQATECSRGSNGPEIVEHAQALLDFVTGTNDAEIVRAARALAEKVKG